MNQQFRSFYHRIYKTTPLLLLIIVLRIYSVQAHKIDSVRHNSPLILSANTQYGKVLATNPYLRQANEPGDANIQYVAFSLQLLKQTTGRKEWEKNYGFPTYGIGIYSANFFDNKGFGAPIAICGIFKGPVQRWGKLSFNYDTGFGFTFNWESFNPAANYFNVSIGAEQSVFIDLGMNFKYRLNPDLDLSLGYSFTHFSNGALKSPNMGLNTFSPKLTLEYKIHRFDPPKFSPTKLPFFKNTSLELSLLGGAKNVVYKSSVADSLTNYKGVYYAIYGFNTIINRQLTRKSKIGIGCSLSYDGSYNVTSYIDHSEYETAEEFQHDKLSLSIFPSYELVIKRLSVVVQPGFYIFRKQSVDKKPLAYQRLGLHYLLGKNLFAGICLRAYEYHVSDFIEWTFGYRIDFTNGSR